MQLLLRMEDGLDAIKSYKGAGGCYSLFANYIGLRKPASLCFITVILINHNDIILGMLCWLFFLLHGVTTPHESHISGIYVAYEYSNDFLMVLKPKIFFSLNGPNRFN